ncbi:ABC transporter ATP-binding protein [Pseudooceanicola sp. C21-150M6]|uniref:ABC transporter ATP-binding protein n=1 Tax=Pseudooceanicola sp. C21-150M6 TaxID=3434355 RepID=UPI003D7FEB51
MTEPLLRVAGLSIRFGGLQALSDVTFDLAPGEIVGLIGPNGAGKTTCFSALVGLNRPQSGTIHFKGQQVLGQKPHRIARAGMTKTFQNTALFPGMTLRENVVTAALSHRNLTEARAVAESCIAELDLTRAADRDVDDLTFPERALGEMARALATEPKLLLLDEVMAALTPVEMTEVMDAIRDIRARQGVAFVVVEHHMQAVMSLSERILVLHFGKLIANGTPQAVAEDPLVIEAYLGADHAEHH